MIHFPVGEAISLPYRSGWEKIPFKFVFIGHNLLGCFVELFQISA